MPHREAAITATAYSARYIPFNPRKYSYWTTHQTKWIRMAFAQVQDKKA